MTLRDALMDACRLHALRKHVCLYHWRHFGSWAGWFADVSDDQEGFAAMNIGNRVDYSIIISPFKTDGMGPLNQILGDLTDDVHTEGRAACGNAAEWELYELVKKEMGL